LNQNIGQMMVIGFEGTKASKDLLDFINKENIGGVILFERNWQSIKQLKSLIHDLQQAGNGQLLVCVDQEGGRVLRFKKPFTRFPCMLDVAKAGKDEAYNIGKKLGEELSDAGINVNFAPVLDVATNVYNQVIGDRSFGKDPLIVAEYGVELMRGLIDGGVMPCGKHFPGHGDTDLDSHLELPHLSHTRKRLDACELIPFKKAIENKIPALMTAHVVYSSIDNKYPASLSKKIVNNLLRNELKYDGIIFSDDLLMKAITNQMKIEEAALLALNAGSDMILVCKDMDCQKRVIDRLHNAAYTGELVSRGRYPPR